MAFTGEFWGCQERMTIPQKNVSDFKHFTSTSKKNSNNSYVNYFTRKLCLSVVILKRLSRKKISI